MPGLFYYSTHLAPSELSMFLVPYVFGWRDDHYDDYKFLNIYAHTAEIQGIFRMNHIGKEHAAFQYFLAYNYGSES